MAGTSNMAARRWYIKDHSVGLVTRTRVIAASGDDAVSIGVLRDPSDLLADMKNAYQSPSQPSNDTVVSLRASAGLERTPQLLIYLINKDSEPSEIQMRKPISKRSRGALGAAEDIIGISLWLPGAANTTESYAMHLTVHMPRALIDDADDIAGTGGEE
ncbi:hypothetical protein D3C80_1304470 [compost metagenome]